MSSDKGDHQQLVIYALEELLGLMLMRSEFRSKILSEILLN